jgi:WD40 repeat protein
VSGRVEGLAFSQDGQHLAIGLLDKKEGKGGGVLLRDRATGTSTHLWPQMPVRAVAFSSDSRLLATGDMRGTGVHLRDLETGEESTLGVGGDRKVRALAFAGERTLVAGMSPWDQQGKKGQGPFVLVWDLREPDRPARSLTGHDDEVWTVAADEKIIVSSARDAMVHIWETATGKLLHKINTPRDGVDPDGRVIPRGGVSPSVALAPNGGPLAVAAGDRVELYDRGTWAKRRVAMTTTDDHDTIWGGRLRRLRQVRRHRQRQGAAVADGQWRLPRPQRPP